MLQNLDSATFSSLISEPEHARIREHYDLKTKSGPKARARTPSKAGVKRSGLALELGPLISDGPRETIAATVPKELAKAVRAMFGARGFSKVVADALARKVVRRNREELVALMGADSGPADPDLVARYRRLFSR